mgnify:CR=1 FL=1
MDRQEAKRAAEQQEIMLKGAEASVEQMELIKQQNQLPK